MFEVTLLERDGALSGLRYDTDRLRIKRAIIDTVSSIMSCDPIHPVPAAGVTLRTESIDTRTGDQLEGKVDVLIVVETSDHHTVIGWRRTKIKDAVEAWLAGHYHKGLSIDVRLRHVRMA